jgi:isoquinoline 1-oxidoreductase alpha subunit
VRGPHFKPFIVKNKRFVAFPNTYTLGAVIKALHFIGRGLGMVSFKINSKAVTFDGEADTPLLWVIRDELNMTGTKFGCGIGQCGACTVHVNGKAQRSCITPVAAVDGEAVTTIEGLQPSEDALHPVQQAWLEHDVPQCGYCQPGQIMATVDFLKKYPNPSDDEIDQNITNLCRCGTYARVRKAIHRAAELVAAEKQS